MPPPPAPLNPLQNFVSENISSRRSSSKDSDSDGTPVDDSENIPSSLPVMLSPKVVVERLDVSRMSQKRLDFGEEMEVSSAAVESEEVLATALPEDPQPVENQAEKTTEPSNGDVEREPSSKDKVDSDHDKEGQAATEEKEAGESLSQDPPQQSEPAVESNQETNKNQAVDHPQPEEPSEKPSNENGESNQEDETNPNEETSDQEKEDGQSQEVQTDANEKESEEPNDVETSENNIDPEKEQENPEAVQQKDNKSFEEPTTASETMNESKKNRSRLVLRKSSKRDGVRNKHLTNIRAMSTPNKDGTLLRANLTFAEKSFDLSAISVLSARSPSPKDGRNKAKTAQAAAAESFKFAHGKKDAFEDMLESEVRMARQPDNPPASGRALRENNASRETSPKPPLARSKSRSISQRPTETETRRTSKRRRDPSPVVEKGPRPVRQRTKNRKYE